MTEKRFVVGQEVWTIGGYKHATLGKSIVTKVGRKFVFVGKTQYHLDTLQEKVDFGEEGQLYITEQDYHDELELKRNKSEISSYFDFWTRRDISLEQTREILKILES